MSRNPVADSMYETEAVRVGAQLHSEYSRSLLSHASTRHLYPCHANIIDRMVANGYDDARTRDAIWRIVMSGARGVKGIVE